MTDKNPKIAAALARLRYLSQDWRLGGDGDSWAEDVLSLAARNAEQHTLACDRRDVVRIGDAIAAILDAITAENIRGMTSPWAEEGM